MSLSTEAILEFRKIWREEYGEDLSFEEAWPIAERFLSTFRLLYLTKRDSPIDADTG